MSASSAKRSSIKTFSKYNSALVGNAFTNPYIANFEHIGTLYGTGSSGVISFTSIPQDYKHLQLRVIANSGPDQLLKFNGSLTTNRHIIEAYEGSTAISSSYSAGMGYLNSGGGTSSEYYANIVDIVDYASTTKTKVARNLSGLIGATARRNSLSSMLWNNTAAITSINIEAMSGSWTTASRFSLYGSRG